MFGLGSFWPWMASKSRCVIKAINYLDKKVIRWPVSLLVVGKKPFWQKKGGRQQGETIVNKYRTDWTSADEL